jgi:hypothetical protein
LLNGCPLEKLMLMGWGSGVYNLLSLVPSPKCVHFASLMLAAKCCWFRRCIPLNKAITIT